MQFLRCSWQNKGDVDNLRQDVYAGQKQSHYGLAYSHPRGNARSHTVTVPNLGGFAGLSVKYANAKVSFGYRGDFFFGAMDDGIDARRSKDVAFHGPFATISVGLGE